MRSENVFKPDPTWEAFATPALEYLANITAQVELGPNVPVDVAKRFEAITKLVLHSYYAYEFLDVAFEQALMGFEMALKLRHEELTGKEPEPNQTLAKLIEWADEQGLFEMDRHVFDSLRKLRNRAAHPDRYRLAGITVAGVVPTISQYINDLYDDVDVRRTRKEKQSEIQSQLNDLVSTGAILELESRRLIIFDATLLYYDNNAAPPFYWLACWPIFHIQPDGSADTNEPLVRKCEGIRFGPEEVFLSLENGMSARLVRIAKPENTRRFEDFRAAYEDSTSAEIVSLHLAQLRSQIRQGHFPSRS